MGDAGRLDGPNLLELQLRVTQVVEEAGAAAEKKRHDGDLHLVHQPGGEVLLRDACAASERDVLAPGGLPRLLERGFDPVGYEVECRSALQLQGLAGVMGEDEDGVMERRVLAPPAVPRVLS